MSDSVKSLPRIVVEQRASDWKAYVQGDEAKWECGHSRSTAIGMLILSHGPMLGVGVTTLLLEPPAGESAQGS